MQNSDYYSIDMEKTGIKLRNYIMEAGYKVRDIQKYLHLSCPQPIYRWFKGKTLPSVNHMYMLCLLLNRHMEDLLVPKDFMLSVIIKERPSHRRMQARMKIYCRMLKEVIVQMKNGTAMANDTCENICGFTGELILE